MDEILGLPAGTLRGNEKLEELENWDSTSLITFIALADSTAGVNVSPAQIVTCFTVADLLRWHGGNNPLSRGPRCVGSLHDIRSQDIATGCSTSTRNSRLRWRIFCDIDRS